MTERILEEAGERRVRLRGPLMTGVVMVVAAAIFVALVVYAAPAYRGSDQCWYVEDVTTIVSGEAPVTHETYPFEYASGTAADSGSTAAKTGFVHNGLALYAWAGAAALLGSVHTGIIAVNILAGLLTALLVYLASLRFAPKREASLFGLLTLFLPVAYWSATQDLAETFSAVFVALALYLVVRFPKPLLAYAGAQACVAAAAAGRLWVAGLLLAVPLAYAILRRDGSPARRIAVASGLVLFGLFVFRGLLGMMPQYGPSFDAMATLQVSRSVSNMVLWFDVLPVEPFSLVGFIGGLSHNILRVIRQQLLVGARLDLSTAITATTQLPTLVLAALTAWGFAGDRTDRTRNTLMCLGLFGFASYFGFLALFQNQARYIVPLLPAVVIGATAGLVSLLRKRTHSTMRVVSTGLLTIAIGMSLLVDCQIAARFRQDSLLEAAARGRMDAVVEAYVPSGARVVLDTRLMDRWVADQALYPRSVFALSTDFSFTRQQYDGWFSEFEPAYLVADETSALPAVYGLDAIAHSDDYSIFQLAPRGLSPD